MSPSIEQRIARVANGSRRRRDLAAVGARSQGEQWQRNAERLDQLRAEEEAKRLEREQRLLPRVRESEAAVEAWDAACLKLQPAITESSWALWLSPLRCIGEVDDAVCLVGPGRAWAERRYGSLIGNTIREVSDFRGVFLFDDPDHKEQEDDGCL